MRTSNFAARPRRLGKRGTQSVLEATDALHAVQHVLSVDWYDRERYALERYHLAIRLVPVLVGHLRLRGYIPHAV